MDSIRPPFKTFETGPKLGHAHTHTLIFLHGRGDNTYAFWNGLEKWRDSQNRTLRDAFPTFRFVLPEAPWRPLARDRSVVWRQWYDLWNTKDFAEREELQAIGLKEVVPGLRKLVAKEAKLLDGHSDRIVLAGMSMGGATASHLLFNLDVPLAAFMGFACRCPFVGRTLPQMRQVLGLEGVPADNEVLRRTPVLLEHCVDDPVVLVQNGRSLRDTLISFGCQVEWIEYPNGGHWFNAPRGMDDAVQFLQNVLSKA
ncbi:phospholipase/carboxylesterase family protein [Poronia punctata]|nr:phospholipase/carboxylesterase family protein [Poronia punctata]